MVGIEGELGALRSRATTLDPNSVTYGNDTIANATVGSWYGVVAGRLGWAVVLVLFYAKGGGRVHPIAWWRRTQVWITESSDS